MRKIIFALALIIYGLTASAQFPSKDSAEKFINKWIRNSAVDAFTNLRLNTAMIYTLRYADSAALLSVTALNDSTLRIITKGKDTFTAVLRGTGGGGSDVTKVPLTRTITINGTTQDLTVNRTWTLVKGDIGLGNVDNTSDINKPVSTAQQTALDGKLSTTPPGSNKQIIYNKSGAYGTTIGVEIDDGLRRISADSLNAKLYRGDSVKLSRQFFTYLPSGLEGYGDSFVFGSLASPRTDSGFIYVFGRYMSLPVTNSALSGTGCFYNIKNFHANIGLSNTRFQIINVGYNDHRATGENPKTHAKTCNAYKAAFVNQFASSYIDAGGTGVTRTGTWTVGINATIHAGKSANAAYTSTLNDTITKAFSGTSIAAVLMGSDGIVSNYSNVDVLIDDVFYATYNTNNQTDGAVVFSNPNHTDSVFTYPVLIYGLSSGSHTIKLVNKSAGQRMFVDYFTTLAAPSTKPPLGIFHLIGIESYYITSNSKVDSMVATLPTGYPFYVYKVNNTFVPLTDMDVDGVHPNNSGHRHYADEMKTHSTPILANLPGGIVTWDEWLYITSNGVSKQVPHTEDVWEKINDNIPFPGSIAIGDAKTNTIKQGTTHLLSYQNTLGNLRIGPSGNLTATGASWVVIGNNAAPALTTANSIIAIGPSACLNCTTGGGSISIGGFTNAFATTGTNTAIGNGAIQFGAGTGNTATGSAALQGNVSFPFNNSTATGSSAGSGNRADNNIYYGSGSGNSQNITGAKNFVMGYMAGLLDPTVGNQLQINNFFIGKGMSGQTTTLLGQLGLKTWYPGRNTVRVGGSFGITLDSVEAKSSATGYDVILIGNTGADTGTVARMTFANLTTAVAPTLTTNFIAVGNGGITGSSALTYDGTIEKVETSAAKYYSLNTDALGSTSGGTLSMYASGTPSASSQNLGTIEFGSKISTNYRLGATIRALTSGAWTDGSNYRTDLIFSVTNGGAATPSVGMRLNGGSRLFVGANTVATATLELAAGTASVAPVKYNAGTLKTTAAAGEQEYDGTSFSFTPTGTTRLRHVLTDYTVPSNGQIPIGNGANYTNATLTAGTGIAVTNGAGSITVGLAASVTTAGTTDFTITIETTTILPSLAGAANRTITFPSAASNTGRRIFIWNSNADANLWSFGSNYTDPNGTTASTIGNGTFSVYLSTGSVWLRVHNN